MDLPPPRVCRGDGNLFIMLLVQPRLDARTQVHQTRPFQRPDRSLKADWLDERSTSNGAVRERVEPARLGGRWFGADGPPSPPPSPRDLQCCLKVRPVGSACARHRAPPRYTKCACGRTLTDHRSHGDVHLRLSLTAGPAETTKTPWFIAERAGTSPLLNSCG